MSVGTHNNFERTGDRDLAFSALMRKPRGVKVCDFDPMPIGPDNLPYVMWEVKRETGNRDWILAHTRYVSAVAEKLGVPAYFIYHRPDDSVVITRLSDFVIRTMTSEEFVKWVETFPTRNKI
jgi:hypothetical protein